MNTNHNVIEFQSVDQNLIIFIAIHATRTLSRSSKSQNLLSHCQNPLKKRREHLLTQDPKKSSTKFHELSITTKKHKTQPSTYQVRHTDSASLATSSFRNEFVFGKGCVLYDKFGFQHKNKDREEIQEYAFLLTLDAPSKAIAKILEKKEKNK